MKDVTGDQPKLGLYILTVNAPVCLSDGRIYSLMKLYFVEMKLNRKLQ